MASLSASLCRMSSGTCSGSQMSALVHGNASGQKTLPLQRTGLVPLFQSYLLCDHTRCGCTAARHKG